jgi:hypothetical protein
MGLSKAYQIIRRFPEDVDLTYDIRVAPDLVGGDAEPLPPNRSQEKRWTKEIRTRLPLWINRSGRAPDQPCVIRAETVSQTFD